MPAYDTGISPEGKRRGRGISFENVHFPSWIVDGLEVWLREFPLPRSEPALGRERLIPTSEFRGEMLGECENVGFGWGGGGWWDGFNPPTGRLLFLFATGGGFVL